LRVISGRLKGRRLAALRGTQTRPTSDRVRESLFNIIGTKPTFAHVLDLFSGTGALGIEALSRGAQMCVFVDMAPQALLVLHKNLKTCGLDSCSKTIQWDIQKNLNCLKPYPQRFDLVFMDPPYDHHMILPTLVQLLHLGIMAPDVLAVAEQRSSEPGIDPPAPLSMVDCRRYGQTRLSFFAFQGQNVP
jgi:16S rRNA (guanine966-N2)-methyltransferase